MAWEEPHRGEKLTIVRFLGPSPWVKIKSACAAASRRRAALAYVTSEIVKFESGDILVVDASFVAIKTGQTNAALLLRLHKRGVVIHSWPRLHAKVVVADGRAFVGSANMSNQSVKNLTEAVMETDAPQAVSQAASFVEQLAAQSQKLDQAALVALTKIKVIKQGPWLGGGPKPKIRLGKNTWLIGVHEEDDTPPDQLEFAEKTRRAVAKKAGVSEHDVSWIRWPGKGRFAMNSRGGDVVIQIWRDREKDKTPAEVLKAVPLLRRERRGNVTFVFAPEATGKRRAMSWPNFKALMAGVGFNKVSTNAERRLRPAIADAVAAAWAKG